METRSALGGRRGIVPVFKTRGTLFLAIIGLLVCCVVMQMVGIRASLWDSRHIEDNSVESSIIGVSALVADAENGTILSVVKFGSVLRPTFRRQVFLSVIFHPPNFS
jgi:hypothetical protein